MRKVSCKNRKKLKISNFLLIFNMLCLYNILLYIYNFFIFFLIVMKKARTLRIIGIILAAWGFWALINLLSQIPFNPLTPSHWLLTVFVVLLIGWAILTLYHARKIKKQTWSIETDEMFKRIGYTSLAASFQLLMWIILLVSLLEGHFHFLETFSANDILRMVWILWLILLGLNSRYFSKNPDKIWL